MFISIIYITCLTKFYLKQWVGVNGFSPVYFQQEFDILFGPLSLLLLSCFFLDFLPFIIANQPFPSHYKVLSLCHEVFGVWHKLTPGIFGCPSILDTMDEGGYFDMVFSLSSSFFFYLNFSLQTFLLFFQQVRIQKLASISSYTN